MPNDALVMEIATEWTAACQVQTRFMQHQALNSESFDLGARCRQMLELGGDFYDFLPLAQGRMALAIGDASGKGLAAALMSSNVQSSLRTAAYFAASHPAEAVGAVNRQLYGSSLAERYATLFYAVFDPRTRLLKYVNAGHPPAMVIRKDGSVNWLESGGAPVGMFSQWTYEEGVVQLEPGDVLIACTDGVTEAVSHRGEDWGVEGLRGAAEESITQSAEQIAVAVFSQMDGFSGGRQTDDAAVVVLRVL